MDTNKRLLSLDIFRGITIAGMILVNNPGSWSTVYPPLLHAKWHGATPTDWIFPFFLFIVGVAIPLAIGKRMEKGDSDQAIVHKILYRVLVIFGLGLFLAAFPKFGMTEGEAPLLHFILLGIVMISIFSREVLDQPHFRGNGTTKIRKALGLLALLGATGMVVIGITHYDFSQLRIPGVLQRIALVYGACAWLFLKTSWRTQLIIGAGLLLIYWIWMTLIPVPGGIAPNLEPETNFGAWLDRALLNDHLWRQSKTWDPEGILSTLPAIVTGISGVLTGVWIKTPNEEYKKITGLLGTGAILLAAGLIWNTVFPINKSLWTSSYVLYTSGIALLFLGLIYWLVDVLRYQGWTYPFLAFGANALFAFIFSGIVVKILLNIKWTTGEGHILNLQSRIYEIVYRPLFSDLNASLAYALTNVLFFLIICIILYRKKIFIKV